MHYTGTIWRPPHEMYSGWIEVTKGCHYHHCRFCSLYHHISFQPSKIEDIIEDCYELSSWYPQVKRIFLIGANPFVLNYNRLKGIAIIIQQYFPQLETIGCFARITDIALKTDEELKRLHDLGYDELSIGVESGNDMALDYMDKGFTSNDIIIQCQRLEKSKIQYHLFYIVGLAGRGQAHKSAMDTARIFNQLHPKSIIVSILTVFERTKLYHDVYNNEFIPALEKETLEEMKIFIDNCHLNVQFFANNISNAVIVEGRLPRDSQKMIKKIQNAIDTLDEKNLINYRQHIHHF